MKMENASVPLQRLVAKMEIAFNITANRWHAGSNPGDAVVYFSDGSHITYSKTEIEDEAIELSR